MGKPLSICEYCYLVSVTFSHGSKSRQSGNNYGIWVDLAFELRDSSRNLIRSTVQTIDLASGLDADPSASDVVSAMVSNAPLISSVIAATKTATSGYVIPVNS